MKCPVCQADLDEVRVHDLIGWNCPTQTDLPAGAKLSHYTVRGNEDILTLFPYRLINRIEDGATVSVLHRYRPDEDPVMGSGRFKLVAHLPPIKIMDEETMLRKLALYVLFS